MPDERSPVQVSQVQRLFDLLAEEYDQSGVPFFGPIAAGLAARLAVAPGERVAELGCGRGALTVLLGESVGAQGKVAALDLSAEMVRHASELVAARGLGQVSVVQGDAAAPPFDAGEYDAVAASLVLFFLPDPAAALARWWALVAPGGRLGISTFVPFSDAWEAIDALFADYQRPPDPDAPPPVGRIASAGKVLDLPDPFTTDEGVTGLFEDAGIIGVRHDHQHFAVPFRDAEQWVAWSFGTGARQRWMSAPEETWPEIRARLPEVLDGYRDAEGTIRMPVTARYSLAAC